MSRVNAHVMQELERLSNEWDRGASEGYEANPNEPPAYWHDTPYKWLTAYQRGYLFGRELRIQELQTDVGWMP